MSDRTFEPMTKAEVVAAQRAWAKFVTERVERVYSFSRYRSGKIASIPCWVAP